MNRSPWILVSRSWAGSEMSHGLLKWTLEAKLSRAASSGTLRELRRRRRAARRSPFRSRSVLGARERGNHSTVTVSRSIAASTRGLVQLQVPGV